jgi:hypothetical protein
VQNKIRNSKNTKEILLNVQTAEDIGTPKIIAISNRDVSNVRVTTSQTKDRVMSDVFSVVKIILRITMDVRSTRTYRIKLTYLSA